MANGRIWTKSEVAKLYDLASRVSQQEAAKRLKRTVASVRDKARALQIRWWQGYRSYGSIAREIGCSPTSVRRTARLIIDGDDAPGAGPRGTTAWRAILTQEQAERIIRVLTGARRYRQHKIRAGLARWKRLDETP